MMHLKQSPLSGQATPGGSSLRRSPSFSLPKRILEIPGHEMVRWSFWIHSFHVCSSTRFIESRLPDAYQMVREVNGFGDCMLVLALLFMVVTVLVVDVFTPHD